ncbi:hypothetical protein FOA52_001969 [Chlamydomonas sp. UWO 241]|nr:hypothetical protein FOA52_001969 [Chlamydomonas sp. UWO 241]
MFRSIVQGAQIASRGTPMTPESETQAALNLRKAVVAELFKRRADIEPFIPGILEGDTTFDAYLERMSHPSAWGGEPEMVMAVNVVRMPINVWRITQAGAELIVSYGDEMVGVPRINLLWHSAGHYDLLVPGGATPPGAAPAA